MEALEAESIVTDPDIDEDDLINMIDDEEKQYLDEVENLVREVELQLDITPSANTSSLAQLAKSTD